MPSRPSLKQGVSQEWLTPQHIPATNAYYRAVQEDVMTWWRANHRQDLPWRLAPLSTTAAASTPENSTAVPRMSVSRTPLYNPYEVWVSEVMSQQTRMETVIPYYHTWMKKFPTIEALAAASEDEVKAVWAGMGYYRRALYLRKGAQYLLEWSRTDQQHTESDHACASSSSTTAHAPMPPTQEELLKVPGIGPYTSAAIASLCFGQAVCSVDGNVIRVLSRLRGERNFDPKVPANVKRAGAWGQELMGNTPRTASVVCPDPSAMNQGLMEIGSSVCRPAGAPLCSACPLQRHCCAYALWSSGDIESIEGVIPVRAAAPLKRSAKEICVVHEIGVAADAATTAEKGSCRFVVVRRPSEGLLAGMLEFPTVSAANGDGEPAADAGVALRTHPLCTLSPIGQTNMLDVQLCGTIRHIFSHIDMDVDVTHVRWPANVDTGCLVDAIANTIDTLDEESRGVSSAAAARISIMTEAELRAAAPSRLMLKVLHQISSSSPAVKRPRCKSTGGGSSASNDNSNDSGRATTAGAQQCRMKKISAAARPTKKKKGGVIEA